MTYDYNSDLFAAIMAKDVDLILTDTPIALYWQQETNDRLTVMGQPRIPSLESGLAIMLAKGNIRLQRQLNQALEVLVKNGAYDQLVERYFNTDKTSFHYQKTNRSGVYRPDWITAN